MIDSKQLRWFVMCLCVSSALMPGYTMAVEQIPQRLGNSLDVRLESDSLCGQLVNQDGIAEPNRIVTLYANSQLIAMETTDGAGLFQFENVRPGNYVLSIDGSVRPCRVWSPQAAPPSASDNILLIANDATVRGQLGDGHGHGFLKRAMLRAASDPWIVGGLIATAVVVPLATRDSGDAS